MEKCFRIVSEKVIRKADLKEMSVCVPDCLYLSEDMLSILGFDHEDIANASASFALEEPLAGTRLFRILNIEVAEQINVNYVELYTVATAPIDSTDGRGPMVDWPFFLLLEASARSIAVTLAFSQKTEVRCYSASYFANPGIKYKPMLVAKYL